MVPEPALMEELPADHSPNLGPEAATTAYLRARALEGRLYPDAVVAQLPDIPPSHPLAHEWRQRADSASRLVRYLRRRQSPLLILEPGCGNGWLANQLAQVPDSRVIGMDREPLELDQAARVFRRPNLTFVPGDVTAGAGPRERPDIIVLASMVQYVADLPVLIRDLGTRLAPGGELHILDSPIYRPTDVAAASERTRRHYARIGVPEMAAAYHHHTWDVLSGFDVHVLYEPRAIRRRLARRLFGQRGSPFPWLRIRP